MRNLALVLLLLAGCGDNLGRSVNPPDAVPDSGSLFGWPCPVASVPGTVYPCHHSAPDTPDGWCVQPPGSPSPVCRPVCQNQAGSASCAVTGGVVWQQDNGNGACVCIPA